MNNGDQQSATSQSEASFTSSCTDPECQEHARLIQNQGIEPSHLDDYREALTRENNIQSYENRFHEELSYSGFIPFFVARDHLLASSDSENESRKLLFFPRR